MVHVIMCNTYVMHYTKIKTYTRSCTHLARKAPLLPEVTRRCCADCRCTVIRCHRCLHSTHDPVNRYVRIASCFDAASCVDSVMCSVCSASRRLRHCLRHDYVDFSLKCYSAQLVTRRHYSVYLLGCVTSWR